MKIYLSKKFNQSNWSKWVFYTFFDKIILIKTVFPPNTRTFFFFFFFLFDAEVFWLTLFHYHANLYREHTKIKSTHQHTCLHLAFRLLNEVVATNPTIGSNVEEFVYKNIRFLMWDLGGQEVLRASWNTYYLNTQV